MMEPRNRYPREPSSYWVRGQYRSTEKVGCRGPAGVKEQGKGTEGASQEPVRSPYSQSGPTVSRRRTGNKGARRQAASSYLTERRRGLGLEPSDESISRWVRVRGSRSVL